MKTAATLAAMFFNKPQATNTTNLRTKFHEDWAINVTSRVLTSYQYNNLRTKFHEDLAINVTSRVLTSKAAPPPGGHIFQKTKTISKLSLSIIKTKVQTEFHEDWTINVTPRQNCPAPWRPCFLPIRTIFKLNRRIQETNVLTTFHEDWTKNVTSRAFTCFHYIHIEKTAPTPGGHVFSPIWTIF
ncbi:hypothetical protein DPMN_080718 [Dreissena polymorpha]|uniref:Uncharacterized protein n=1 Tax=Dreissena polymorpha TaxID=45954 RepID=A0A9D3YW75_DREPO|nr:hypothetical protein DPMN_080718 [Dreissena polymorpha]